MTTEIILNYGENENKILNFDISKVLYSFSFGNTDKETEEQGKTLHITFKPETTEERIQIYDFADILNNNKINNIEYSVIKNEIKTKMFNALELIKFNTVKYDFIDGAMNHELNSTNWENPEEQYTSKFVLYFN